MESFWYSKSISDTLKSFRSDENGLTQEEVKVRIEKYGFNKLPDAKLDSLLLIFLRQFQSPLIYILIFASVIVFLMKEFIAKLLNAHL